MAHFGKYLTCELERRSPDVLDPLEKLGVAIHSCDSILGSMERDQSLETSGNSARSN